MPPVGETEAEKTDSFFINWVDPQAGHLVPCQSDDRVRISLSFPHFRQWNS